MSFDFEQISVSCANMNIRQKSFDYEKNSICFSMYNNTLRILHDAFISIVKILPRNIRFLIEKQLRFRAETFISVSSLILFLNRMNAHKLIEI